MTERITTYDHEALTFDVLDGGPIDGVPVVLLHGFPGRASDWEAVTATLREHGFRTLALDQRGYSPGARPRGRLAYRMHHLVNDLVALVDRIGGPVHVVGHDWGAVVGWHLAASRPELLRTLTAVSVPHPSAFARAIVTSDQALRSWYAVAFQPPVLAELVMRTMPGLVRRGLRESGLSEPEVRRVDSEVLRSGALPGALAWYRAALLPGQSCGRIGVPTTYVWSDGDAAVSRRAAELCGNHVDGDYELVVLEGLTHWLPTQAPDVLAEIVLERIT